MSDYYESIPIWYTALVNLKMARFLWHAAKKNFVFGFYEKWPMVINSKKSKNKIFLACYKNLAIFKFSGAVVNLV